VKGVVGRLVRQPGRIIASIEDPDVIEKILKHLGLDQVDWASPDDPQNRSPPSDLTDQQTTLFKNSSAQITHR
jgi:hypothetical protein